MASTNKLRQSRLNTYWKMSVVIPAAVVLMAVFGWFSVVTYNVIFPNQGVERHSDVIVALAPGENRVHTALELYERGQGDELAISWFPPELAGNDPDYILVQAAAELCGEAEHPLAHCFTPTEVNTQGEALAVAELMREHGWEAVTVVTSRYHVFRTNYIFEKVLPEGTDIEVITAPTQLSLLDWVYRIAYENAAFIKAIFTPTPSTTVP